MSLPADSPTSGSLSPDQARDYSFPAQHSRSSSVQSSTSDYELATAGKEVRFPDIVRRDMEFFMARLTKTTSNESTSSTQQQQQQEQQ
ncbi:20429c64-db14-4693-9d77-4fb3dcfef9f2 [Thermothielavioides terrestris]|uniref:20429c64-db14-4693-9d77-4fb3dcfef9f2 n=1 Tax=Thermothielavioides terrestris TaxID=2587410 RepID=A0A3S4F5N5_9PEZI|nr:20429c64-db14-4693-9d77-4fb3dcfef9f2 [Thermothielavioides terrestris]